MSEKAKAEDSKPENEEGATASRADQLRLQLKLITNYIMVGFAPIASAAALALAIAALVGNQSAQSQSGNMAAKLDKLNASLSASKAETEKLRAELNQEKLQRDNERKQQQELLDKVVPALSHLQTKLKIAPTLEEQLKQPAPPPAAASAPVPTSQAGSPPSPKPTTEVKDSAQIKALKQALEKFNQQ